MLRSSPARLLSLLVLMAFVMRGLVPTGYMINRSDDGTITVELCGSFGVRMMALDPVTGELSELPEDTPQAPEGHATCAYALSAAATLPEPVQPPTPIVFAGLMLGSVPLVAPETTLEIRAPLPARGPPVRV